MTHTFFGENYDEIERLVRKFEGHAADIHFESIRHWISQYDVDDYGLALKLLQNIDYYTNRRVCGMLRKISGHLETIPNYNFDKAFFSTFHLPAKSDQIIQERFRFANLLKDSKYQYKFIGITDINKLRDDPENLFFFLEDFVGTGNSIVKYWRNAAQIISEIDNLYLAIICGHEFGIQKIQENTGFKVTAGKIIPEKERFYSEHNPIFDSSEQDVIMKYCEKVGHPVTGWGGCQSNVIFYSRAPNSTLPIFWKDVDNNYKWQGLFKRHYEET